MRCAGPIFLLLLALCCLPCTTFASSGVGANQAQLPTADEAEEHVKLGDSAVDLTGPWKFNTGDDMAWAQPDFDDSSWSEMDLTPPPDSSDLPGWTARGYRQYSGYAWYRLKLSVEGAGRALALKMPDSADDAYQVYVNGAKIGEFGKFGGRHVTAYTTLPRAFRLPKDAQSKPITIAIRMWMDSATRFNFPDAGGMHEPPVLGYASVIGGQIRLDWDGIGHSVGSGFLEMLILIMALLMALALYWADKEEESYLWLAIVCIVTILGNSVVLAASFTTWIGQTAAVILADVILRPMRIGLWVLFWGYWFRLLHMRQLHVIVWTQVLLLMICTAMLRPPLYGQHVPVEASSYLVPIALAIKLGLGLLLLTVAYRGFKRQKTEGGLAAAAVLLAVISNYQSELRLIHVQTTSHILGFRLTLGTVSTILSLLIITIMLLRRFINAQRQKEQWKLEIQQARQVQQVLIPHQLPQVKGLSIESEYRPAREVGGDYFQILPGEVEGTALIVVGDVTGKGLQAGMLVALIVGAIRTAVQNTSDPSQIMSLVNEQLCEREHASSTCMILRIAPDGTVTLANAGHLPPYLNGKEMEIEGALPLGIIPEMEFSSVTFRLGQGDSLILMSDGIAEAQDARGKLFGFDRVNDLLKKPVTAADIASAAEEFGQQDDILVLRVLRKVGETLSPHPEPQLSAK